MYLDPSERMQLYPIMCQNECGDMIPREKVMFNILKLTTEAMNLHVILYVCIQHAILTI